MLGFQRAVSGVKQQQLQNISSSRPPSRKQSSLRNVFPGMDIRCVVEGPPPENVCKSWLTLRKSIPEKLFIILYRVKRLSHYIEIQTLARFETVVCESRSFVFGERGK